METACISWALIKPVDEGFGGRWGVADLFVGTRIQESIQDLKFDKPSGSSGSKFSWKWASLSNQKPWAVSFWDPAQLNVGKNSKMNWNQQDDYCAYAPFSELKMQRTPNAAASSSCFACFTKQSNNCRNFTIGLHLQAYSQFSFQNIQKYSSNLSMQARCFSNSTIFSHSKQQISESQLHRTSSWANAWLYQIHVLER